MLFPATFASNLSEHEAFLLVTSKSQSTIDAPFTFELIRSLSLKLFLDLFGYTEISLRLYTFLPIALIGLVTIILVSIMFRNIKASLFIVTFFLLALFANYVNLGKIDEVNSKAFFEMVGEKKRGDDIILLWTDANSFKYRARYYMGETSFIEFETPALIPTRIMDGKRKIPVNRIGVITTLKVTDVTIPNYQLVEYNEVPPLKIIWLQKK